MKLIIEIPEEDYKFVKEAEGCRYSKTVIDGVINGTPIPDNATNGDVIEAMFPKAEIEENDVTNTFGIIWEKTERLTIYNANFARVWWDAPYREERNADNQGRSESNLAQ